MSRTLLVVDDDPVIRDLVVEVLRFEGYQAAGAADGEAALNWLDRDGDAPPAAILLDMRMPILDGWGFAEAYRRRPPPRARIIVMTAATDASACAASIGADGVLAKPFELDELLAVVANVGGGCQ